MSAARRAAAALALLALLVFAGFGLARAVGAGGARTQQEQVDAISATIRCPTCQGLSIKDSPSILADGSRQIVEEQVRQGRSPDEVRQYFVDRYGSYILLSPDTGGSALVVWLLPGLVVLGGAVFAWRWLRHGRDRDRLPAQASAGLDDQTDGDALLALQAHASGTLEPDGSPAGEALREALTVRLAAAGDALDPDALRRADLRLGAAYRRYHTRERRAAAAPGRALPRRTVTVVTVGLLVVATGTALAFGVRSRGAGDLPTGDLPGGAPAAAAPSAPPGLAELQAATVARPDDAKAWVALGRAYQAGGQPAKALAAYDNALELAPADDVALLRAGVLVDGGSPGEALPVLTRLAARYPDDPDTLLLLGLAQDRTGSPAGTVTLRRFLAVAPDAPAAAQVRALLAGR